MGLGAWGSGFRVRVQGAGAGDTSSSDSLRPPATILPPSWVLVHSF